MSENVREDCLEELLETILDLLREELLKKLSNSRKIYRIFFLEELLVILRKTPGRILELTHVNS